LEFRDISRISEAITAKRMKIDPHCQQRNCRPLNVLFSGVQIALISQVVPQLGGVKQSWGGKKVFVHTRLSRAYLALARLSCFSFGRCLRRNHVFQIWWRSVQGFSVGWWSNFAIPHWLWRSSLQYSHTTVWACDLRQ